MQDLLDKIHSKAYWRLVIRPTEFDARRIPSLSKCQDIVRSSQVVLRGWDYPFIDRIQVGQDWIESECDSDVVSHYEYWRFYQSGQFAHHFSCWEEFRTLPWTPSPPKYLTVLNTLYTVTEVFEFGARIAHHANIGSALEFAIQLHGMQERQLVFGDISRGISLMLIAQPPVARIDTIEYNLTLPVTTLLGSASEAALDAAVAIFERFGWLNPSRSLLEKDQQKFLERKLGV